MTVHWASCNKIHPVSSQNSFFCQSSYNKIEIAVWMFKCVLILNRINRNITPSRKESRIPKPGCFLWARLARRKVCLLLDQARYRTPPSPMPPSRTNIGRPEIWARTEKSGLTGHIPTTASLQHKQSGRRGSQLVWNNLEETENTVRRQQTLCVDY